MVFTGFIYRIINSIVSILQKFKPILILLKDNSETIRDWQTVKSDQQVKVQGSA